jgi:predicted  nucleic acid-binding Zn-ribbon protein
MTNVADLYALQEIDSALDARRASLADAESRVGETEELVEARERVSALKQGLEEAEKQQREQEWEIDDLREKIEPLEKRLYGGTIRNPKELEDLQQDVQSLKKRQRALEDRDLEIMVAVEEAQRSNREAQELLAEVQAAWEVEQERLARQQAELRSEIAALEQRRGDQIGLVDSPVLGLYENLRTARQGRAVAKVERGTCQGCRISLPMNIVHRARGGTEIVQCSSCERILYVS